MAPETYVWLSIKAKEKNANDKSGTVTFLSRLTSLAARSAERLGKTKKTSDQLASKLGIHSPSSNAVST